MPPPAAIDLVGSYARRRGPDVELVLWEPESVLSGETMTLALRKGRTDVTGTVDAVEDSQGKRLVCRAPRRELTDGTWSITLRSPDPEPVGARLLVQGERPVVLLWSQKGSGSLVPAARRRPTAKRRAAAAGGRALDAALSPLPPVQAARARAAARRTARKILR